MEGGEWRRVALFNYCNARCSWVRSYGLTALLLAALCWISFVSFFWKKVQSMEFQCTTEFGVAGL